MRTNFNKLFLKTIAVITMFLIGAISAEAVSPNTTLWDFGIYTIELPEDVQLKEGTEDSNPPLYTNPEQTFLFFPGFFAIDEEFDPVDFLHELALIYYIDTNELGMMLLTTGKESPLYWTSGINETHTFFVGIYPDYQQGIVSTIAFAVANEEEAPVINYGASFRVIDDSDEEI